VHPTVGAGRFGSLGDAWEVPAADVGPAGVAEIVSDLFLALSAAGFEPRVVPFNHSELEPGRYGVFVAVGPA
jgi:hypothetical protein